MSPGGLVKCFAIGVSLQAASGLTTPAAVRSPYTSLASAPAVLRVSDGASVSLTDEWKSGERAAVFFFRSFG
eukprot:scaffold8641_cov134-Isochrysis_galbana.AAC.5